MLHTTHTSHHTQAHTPHMLYTHPHTHLSEKVKVLVTQLCLTLYSLWTVVYQAPLSMEFSRQEYWSGLPSISPGESSWPRDWTWVCYTAGGFFTAWAIREDPHTSETHTQNHMLRTINTHVHLIHVYRPCCTHTPHTPCACSARRLALHPLRTTSLRSQSSSTSTRLDPETLWGSPAWPVISPLSVSVFFSRRWASEGSMGV